MAISNKSFHILKLFFSFFIVISFLSSAIAEDIESCPSNSSGLLASSRPECSIDFSIQSRLLAKEIKKHAQGNRPDQAVIHIQKLESLLTTQLSCHPNKSCKDLDFYFARNLPLGWSEKFDIQTFETTSEDGSKCNIFPSLHYCRPGQTCDTDLSLGNTNVIRGVISRKSGRLMYTPIRSACSPKEFQINRMLVITDHGLLIVDKGDSEHIHQQAGYWNYLKKKRSPQFSILNNGQGRFTLATGVTVDVDAATGKVVESNLLNPEMFNSEHCKTKLTRRRTRTNVPMQYKQGAKRKYISKTMLDFGGRSQEREHDRFIGRLRRENLP